MNGKMIYEEKLTSKKTTVLFTILACLMGILFYWRINTFHLDMLTIIFLTLFLLFIFYSINYRNLNIQMTTKALTLKFGVFKWAIDLKNIDDCQMDTISGLMKYGGAGIHFMFVNKRYRASFNFLEYPRVVISFKKKIGPVSDLSFSTSDPEKAIQLVQNSIRSLSIN